MSHPHVARKYIGRKHSFGPKLIPKPLVLIVEDDSTQLLLRKAVLEKAGYNVIGVTNTDDAIHTLCDAPVCCVIADHGLRGTSGSDAAQSMKRVKPDVPIILFSGSNPDHMRGVDVFIRKGEPTETFLSIVADVVRRYCT